MVEGVYKNVFKTRIKEARKRTGFTQADVEDEIGIARSSISQYENGKLEPSIDTLGTLAAFYDVSTDWLLGLGRNAGNITAQFNSEATKQLEKEARRLVRRNKYIGIEKNYGNAYVKQH